MQLTTSNYISIMISLIAILGLAVHDTRIDKLVIKAMTSTAVVSDFNSGIGKFLSAEHHIHVDANNFGTGGTNLKGHQPATQPKTDDERKYIAAKRLKNNAFGNEYIWPSI